MTTVLTEHRNHLDIRYILSNNVSLVLLRLTRQLAANSSSHCSVYYGCLLALPAGGLPRETPICSQLTVLTVLQQNGQYLLP